MILLTHFNHDFLKSRTTNKGNQLKGNENTLAPYTHGPTFVMSTTDTQNGHKIKFM